MYKTREEWLKEAVNLINTKVFEGDLNDEVSGKLIKYQIGCSLFSGNKMGDTVMPYDGDDIKSEDEIFPPTIHIDERIKEVEEIVGTLTHECIHCFKGIKSHGKAFKEVAKRAGFEAPFTHLHMNERLCAICREIAEELGPWPGNAIVPHKKDRKERTFSGKLFCPECGNEYRVSEKMWKDHGQSLPTCPCGCKMALDCEDIDIHEDDENN